MSIVNRVSGFGAFLLLIGLLSGCAPVSAPSVLESSSGENAREATATEERVSQESVAEEAALQEVVPPPESILFIGDSFSYWNEGLHQHLKAMASQSVPPHEIHTDRVAQPDQVLNYGAYEWTLKGQWESKHALRAIEERNWDVVVLQEGFSALPRENLELDQFYEYVRKFDQAVSDAEAQTILYMVWPPPSIDWITMEDVVAAHREIAEELGADVAPVGLAWERAIEERPDLVLYEGARSYPTVLGTFLIVNVHYATLFGKSPIGHTYRPADIYPDPEEVDPSVKEALEELRAPLEISEDDAAFLQRIAWEAVLDYYSE